MTDSETRVLARTAAVLLVVSAARYGWEVRSGPPVQTEVRDDLPALLAESRRLAEENERRARPLDPAERLDPNEASEVELDRLPGVGPAGARAIVESRDRDGPFGRPEDLLRVRGIGAATLERIRPHLAFDDRARAASRGPPARPGAPLLPPAGPSGSARGGPASEPPLDLNRAGAEELERLPGVGPALARRILEARAARGRFRSPDELLEIRGIGPTTLERLRPRVRAGP